MMKKIVSLLLSFALIFSLVSCASSLTEESTEETKGTVGETATPEETEKETGVGKDFTLPEGFSAGFAKEVVNPENGVFLGGFSGVSHRVNETTADDIYLSCLAVSDGENVFFYFSMDSTQIGATIAQRVASIAEKSFGIPADHVIINATHTHSGPGMYSTGSAGMVPYVRDVFYPAAERLMAKALKDLSAATLKYGTSEAKGMNYVRRYVSLETNAYLGKNLSSGQDPAKVAHESEADSVMRVLRFVRDGKEDIVLCNWQCHPCTAGIGSAKATILSSDWISTLRKTVEETEKVQFIYMQGAAGNLSNNGRIKGEKVNSDYRKFGTELASFVSLAMENGKEVATGNIQVKREDVKVNYSKEYQTQNNSASSHTMSLWAISFGGVGIATLPGELHDSLGVLMREKSPYDVTLFSGYTNGTHGYFAADFAYENGGYEVDSSRHVRGTSEEMVEKLVGMLGELHQTNS